MITLIAQQTQVVDIAAKASSISAISSLGRLIEIAASAILIVGGLAFLFYLLMGGVTWITAGGDKGKVEKAREMITQGIIGIAILASVFALYGVVLRFLGIKGISLGSGGGGSTAQCSDFCATTAECSNQGGREASKPCSFDHCSTGLVPCLP